MSCRAVDPGGARKGEEAKLPCRPLAGATRRPVGVLRREWHRATAQKPPQACETHTDEPDEDQIDEMAVW